MKHKGVVFFDVDGTLIDWTKKIYAPTKVTKDAIIKLKRKWLFNYFSNWKTKKLYR